MTEMIKTLTMSTLSLPVDFLVVNSYQLIDVTSKDLELQYCSSSMWSITGTWHISCVLISELPVI